MRLPHSNDLPIEKLASVFNDTTNSYKYYWFLSLLETVKQDSKTKTSIDLIILDMIGSAWYPINYFKLSFGKQDQLSNSVLELQNNFSYPKDIKKKELKTSLVNRKDNYIVKNIIQRLSRYVPYRFISPWFTDIIRGIPDSKKNELIATLSNQYFVDDNSPSIYRIAGDMIEINPIWKQYLTRHLAILQGFLFWHLSNYLQRNNPNVPSISEKLSPPEVRSLTTAKLFWNSYIEIKGTFRCIYSAERLFKNNFSIDHFLPWSFVAHDQLWNLVPTPKYINSAKGDCLPSIVYLEKFAEIQYDSFQTNRLRLREKTLEDYSILFSESTSVIAQFDKSKFMNIIIENIKPLMQIASNMGFTSGWKWGN